MSESEISEGGARAQASGTLAPGAINTRPSLPTEAPAPQSGMPGASDFRGAAPNTLRTDALGSTQRPSETAERPDSTQTQADVDANLIDDVFFDSQATPERYRFENAPAGAKQDPQQELAMRELFATEQVPIAVARQLSTLWNKALANPPTEAMRAASKAQTLDAMARSNPERAEETIRLAQEEVARIAQRNPGVINMLEVSGLGNDRWLIEHLANQARARTARAARSNR